MAAKNRKKYHKQYYNYQKLIKFLKQSNDGNQDIKSNNKRIKGDSKPAPSN